MTKSNLRQPKVGQGHTPDELFPALKASSPIKSGILFKYLPPKLRALMYLNPSQGIKWRIKIAQGVNQVSQYRKWQCPF